MGRSIWGTATECAGAFPVLVGAVAGGTWSLVNGDNFNSGAEKAADKIGDMVEKAADYVDDHKSEINDAVKSVAVAVVAAILTGTAHSHRDGA